MTFVATSTDMMQELELAKQQKSLEVLNNIAHKLLPSYQHFHIHTLTGHLKYLEKAADWEEDKINAAVDAVITTTRQVHTASKDFAGLGKLAVSLFDTQLLHLVVKRFPINSQHLGSFALVVVGLLQGLQNHFFLCSLCHTFQIGG